MPNHEDRNTDPPTYTTNCNPDCKLEANGGFPGFTGFSLPRKAQTPGSGRDPAPEESVERDRRRPLLVLASTHRHRYQTHRTKGTKQRFKKAKAEEKHEKQGCQVPWGNVGDTHPGIQGHRCSGSLFHHWCRCHQPGRAGTHRHLEPGSGCSEGHSTRAHTHSGTWWGRQ